MAAPERRSGVWPALLAGWGVFALLSLAGRAWMRARAGQTWPDALLGAAGPTLWNVAVWILLSAAALHLAGRVPLLRLRTLAWVGAAGTGLSVLGVALLVDLPCRFFPGAACNPDRLGGALASAPLMLTMVVNLLGVGYALSHARRRHEDEIRAGALEAELAHAQVAALTSQLQPHFLFNTLQSISTLMRRDVAAAERMTARLGELLRRTLAGTERQEVPLAEELRTVALYTGIEQVRFRDRLRVETLVPPEASDALVPNFLLQPLVENAIRHAVALSPGPGRIEVAAEVRGGELRVRVRDDGPGLAASADAGRPGGVGLENTRERLRALYGPAARLELWGPPGEGLTVSITLPLRRAPAEPGEPVSSS